MSDWSGGTSGTGAARRRSDSSPRRRCRLPSPVARPPDAYDLVCDFYFLDRTLFDDIRAAVRPGGLFVAAIHLADPGDPPDRLLAPGELARILAPWGWELDLVESPSLEHGHDRSTAHLIAHRPR